MKGFNVSKPNKCRTKFCRGITTASGHSPYCSRCRERNWKARNPITYAFKKLRSRAAERGHAFHLSIEKFTELWNAGMGAIRGKTGHSMTIHRKNNDRGYYDNNVTYLTNSCNVRMRYVPYFRNKAAEEAAIAETQKEIALAYPNGFGEGSDALHEMTR
jgi:hypothetical protein